MHHKMVCGLLCSHSDLMVQTAFLFLGCTCHLAGLDEMYVVVVIGAMSSMCWPPPVELIVFRLREDNGVEG